MAMWAKYEVRKITERKNNSVYKTAIIDHEWFELGNGPECYVEKDGIIYCTTMDYKTQATKPE